MATGAGARAALDGPEPGMDVEIRASHMFIGESSSLNQDANLLQFRAADRSERQQSARARRELARWQVRLSSLDLSEWQFQPRDDTRSYLRLPSISGCETWLIHWPPGSEAPLHDHGDASAVAVVLRGELRERAVLGEAWFERSWQTQTSLELPKHIRHNVWNESKQDAYSVHVYAPSLARMTFYEQTVNGMLRAIRTEESQQW